MLNRSVDLVGCFELDDHDDVVCKKCHKIKKKCLLFIPCKLGIDDISPVHQEIIKRFLGLKSSIGMIGKLMIEWQLRMYEM